MRTTRISFKYLFIAAFSCCLVIPNSFAETGFSDWKKQQQSEFRQGKTTFKTYKDETKAAFKEYKRKTAKIWGKDNFVTDKKHWVSYIDQLNQRSIVDFEKGTVTVEVAIPVNQAGNDENAKKQLEQVLLKAMKLGDDNRRIEKIAQQPVSQSTGKPVLAEQIAGSNGNAASPGDYRAIAHDTAGNARKKTLRGDDGETRIVYQAQLNLVPEHIRIRAAKYQPLVNKYAAEHNVPAPVVFAVMETESMFNPTARSAAPAFGLMQLVPGSGARDAYKYLYNKDKIVSDQYLYDPENNIRLGSAYLRRLNSAYLNGIKSEQSRMLATIAAYNTGAGNVFRTFAGKYSSARFGSYSKYKKAALDEINKRSPEQVYQYLRTNLPYSETRKYIKKVTERIAKYTAV